jgi:aryl-alcohol dehydrogenase-like predicted oxidoreductase
MHLLTPAYLEHQLQLSLREIGVQTLDAFLVDQPEVHLGRLGKEAFLDRLLAAFERLERARADGRIRCYGISTYDSLRVAPDDPRYLSLAALVGLAERAARAVHGRAEAAHGLRLVELPFNQAMPEAYTRFNQATDAGETSVLQAARLHGVYVVASHTLAKGRLAAHAADAVARALPDLANDAQRAVQYNRSTPGVGTTLVGAARPAHLDDLVAVSRRPLLAPGVYASLYRPIA